MTQADRDRVSTDGNGRTFQLFDNIPKLRVSNN
jgi:hypothetical protein